MTEELRMYNPCSPGEVLLVDYLKPYGISARELATRMKVAPSTVSRLLKAEIRLTADMALRLSAVLGGSPGSWLNMQKNYDLWQAEQSFDDSGLERIEFSLLPRVSEESLTAMDSRNKDLPAEVV